MLSDAGRALEIRFSASRTGCVGGYDTIQEKKKDKLFQSKAKL